MFLQLADNALQEISAEQIREDCLTVGYVNVEELIKLNGRFGFDESTVAACQNSKEEFRTGVEVYPDYTFTNLRIMNLHEQNDDFIALYLRRNLILVVDAVDYDGSTKGKYLAAIRKYPPQKINSEKIIATFLDSLLAGDQTALERIENDLADQEEALLGTEVDKDFNLDLLKSKKQLSKRRCYYAQLMDITDALCENDNDILDEKRLIHIDNVSKRINRLYEETEMLKSTVEHLQDAYSSALDAKMNQTMKIFTVLTSIFFPLTIIVGWYGMNFQSMPEFTWKYGYFYVILLSIVTVAVLAIIGKRKKWF